ncbi:MAG: hypothetical protein EZS28_042411, partial [Streblomastix strix]
MVEIVEESGENKKITIKNLMSDYLPLSGGTITEGLTVDANFRVQSYDARFTENVVVSNNIEVGNKLVINKDLRLEKTGLYFKNDNASIVVDDSNVSINAKQDVTINAANDLILNGTIMVDGDIYLKNLYAKDSDHIEVGNIIKSPGYIHYSTPSDEYLLLAGGGTKAISDFSGGGTYLPLTGGTITGDLTVQGDFYIFRGLTLEGSYIGVGEAGMLELIAHEEITIDTKKLKIQCGVTEFSGEINTFNEQNLKINAKVNSNGFIHATSPYNNYVLLAGGDVKLISDFVTPIPVSYPIDNRSIEVTPGVWGLSINEFKSKITKTGKMVVMTLYVDGETDPPTPSIGDKCFTIMDDDLVADGKYYGLANACFRNDEPENVPFMYIEDDSIYIDYIVAEKTYPKQKRAWREENPPIRS